jgi:hypothetical protein
MMKILADDNIIFTGHLFCVVTYKMYSNKRGLYG